MSVQVVEFDHRWNGTPRLRPRTDRIIIHHAASAGDIGAEAIHRDHASRRDANGKLIYLGIMYHFVIRFDGTAERGRPVWALGGHAKDNNADSIGICLAGNFERHPPTWAQMHTLADLIDDLEAEYGELTVVGHGDVNATSCPGRLFPWAWLRERLGPLPATHKRVKVRVDGELLAASGYLIGSTSFVPVRLVAEALGATVDWHDGTVIIERPAADTAEPQEG